MPSSTQKQANTARLAVSLKNGEVPSSKVGKSVRSMASMSFDKLKHFFNTENLTIDEKKKILYGLKLCRKQLQKENSLTMSPIEPTSLEEDSLNTERNVIAKTFTVDDDFDKYVNQNRGIQFSSKELDSISNFKNRVTPTSQDRFSVCFETTDDFGNNTTTVIKKYKQGNQFVFASFSKHDNSNQEEPEEPEKVQQPTNKQKPPIKTKPPNSVSPNLKQPSNNPIKEDLTNNKVIVTKTITFQDEIKGADILSDFLRKLDL